MSEAARSRYALDLDEIERQIREASSRPAAPGQAMEDPLAELARIVSGNPRPRQEPPVTASLPQLGALPAYPSVTPRDLNQVVAREFSGAPPANEYHPHESAGLNLEQDIERLLSRRAASEPQPINHDEFAEVMRSFERVISEPAAAQAQPAMQGIEAQMPAQDMHVQQPLDFNSELADMMAAQEAASQRQAEQGEPSQPDPNAVYDQFPDLAGPIPPVRSRKKSLMLVAAVVGVAAVGVGGALSFRGAGGIQANGQPPLIKAAEGPAKVAPVNPGGAVVPDQNRQILERTAAPAGAPAAKVVATEEQPLDLKEAVKREGSSEQPAVNSAGHRIILSTPMTTTAPQTTGSTGNTVEPRKVKTVVIKPPSATPVVQAPPAAGPIATAPAPTVQAPPAPVKVAAVPPKQVETPAPAPSQPAPVAQAPKPKPKPVAETRRAQPAQPAPAPEEPAATGTAPMPIVPSGAPKRNQRLQQQAAVATPTQTDAAPTARATGGSFVVQLSSEGTDAEARSAASRFKNRYAELGDYDSSIQQREVNGQTRYRVRFGGMTRDDANALCSSLKGKGQACIIQPN